MSNSQKKDYFLNLFIIFKTTANKKVFIADIVLGSV